MGQLHQRVVVASVRDADGSTVSGSCHDRDAWEPGSLSGITLMLTGLANSVNPQWAWTFPLALIIVVVSIVLFTPIIRRVREHRYAIQATEGPAHATDRDAIAREFKIPEVQPGTTSIAASLEALYRPVDQIHKTANQLQTTYHNRVGRAIICLVVALVALGLSLTIFHYDAGAKALASAIDIFALSIALQQWWAAHSANHRWVATRTRAELLRQWTFLTALLSAHTPSDLVDRADELFREKDKEIEDKVVQSRMRTWWRRVLALFRPSVLAATTIEGRVSSYWANYRLQCKQMVQGNALSPDDIALYIRRRPVRQLAWFSWTMARLQIQAKSRIRWLAFLYTVSVVLACIKTALAHKQDISAVKSLLELLPPSSSEIVSLALLLMTILSAAATGLYLSRNDRSLLHRYATQERYIGDWLKGWHQHEHSPVELQIHYLLDFEDLMVEEIIDWIHITAHDTFELSV